MSTPIDGGLRGIFRDKFRQYDWQSIETGGTGHGVADSNFCYNGAEGWIEFKQTDGYDVRFRPGQPGWLERRARHGGYVFVAVRRWHDGGPRKGPAVDDLWLLAGGAATLIQSYGLRREQRYVLGVWEGGVAGWNWDAVGEILTRRHARGTEDTGG